jgi:SSS family solute:Na+ symporter
MAVIIVGCLIGAFLIIGQVDGGFGAVVSHASEQGKFRIFPAEMDFWVWLTFFGSFITLAFGSIPQQDVFQRVMSAKDEKTAVWGTVIGGSFYMVFCFVPMFIAVAATMINADLLNLEDMDAILPTVFLKDFVPFFIKVLFFGAVLSALMSTASGTLLAPAAIISENILKDWLKLNDKSLLLALRICVFVFGVIIYFYALAGERMGKSVYDFVESAYFITLCGAIVPLAAGVYWKRANLMGCYLSIGLGVSTWIILSIIDMNFQEALGLQEFTIDGSLKFPPHVAGFFMAILGMVIGSLAFGKTSEELQKEAAAATASA